MGVQAFSFVGIFIAVIFIYILAKLAEQRKADNQAPVEDVNATLIRKYSKMQQTQTPNAGDITGALGYTVSTVEMLYALFQLEDGTEKRFTLKGSEYAELEEGKSGVLTFKGSRFISFK